MTACTVFDGFRRIAGGDLLQVSEIAREANEENPGRVFVYDDSTGKIVDLDPRGSQPEPRGPGRPKLGVVAREVTLLPRHWDWLNAQPGGASVALRKLVEEARRASGDKDRQRASQEAAYRFMSSIAGDLPGFEEAARALFASDRRAFGERIASWPQDVRDYAIRLGFADLDPSL
jgi:hypothetical protein